MIALKYFESFSESENKSEELPPPPGFGKNPDPKDWDYNNEDNSFNFEFYGDETNPYSVKVFPDVELFVVYLPDGGFKYCSYSALKSNANLFKDYEDGVFYKWLLRVIMHVEYSMIKDVRDWDTLDKSIFGKQE